MSVKLKERLRRGKADMDKLKTIGNRCECEERGFPAEAGWKREGRVQLLNPDRRPLRYMLQKTSDKDVVGQSPPRELTRQK